MHISLQFLAFKPRSKSVGDGDSGVALSLSSSLKSSSYDADHLDSTSSQVKSGRCFHVFVWYLVRQVVLVTTTSEDVRDIHCNYQTFSV